MRQPSPAFFSRRRSRVTFCGGEPTLYRRLVELLDHARSLGLQTAIITNGAMLTAAHVERLDMVGATLDAVNESVLRALGRSVGSQPYLETFRRVYTSVYTSVVPKSYSVASARAKLATIVDEVASGNDVEITRRGKKVAVVLSAARYARLRGDRVAFSTAYDAFLAEHDLSSAGDGTWIEGTRDRSPGRDVKL